MLFFEIESECIRNDGHAHWLNETKIDSIELSSCCTLSHSYIADNWRARDSCSTVCACACIDVVDNELEIHSNQDYCQTLNDRQTTNEGDFSSLITRYWWQHRLIFMVRLDASHRDRFNKTKLHYHQEQWNVLQTRKFSRCLHWASTHFDDMHQSFSLLADTRWCVCLLVDR